MPRRRRMAGVYAVVLAAAVGKIGWESLTGASPAPTSLPAGVAVVGAAHAAGLVVGAAAAILTTRPGR